MRTYKTASHDTWDVIAKRVYGREDLMSVLISANYQHRHTVFFKTGTALNVPDVDVTARADDVNLPPWKRKK